MSEISKTNQSFEKAKQIIQEHGGVIRTVEALKAGIHPRNFYALRDQGILEQVSRGVYRLAGLPPMSNLDIVAVATRIPRAVICLISALSFHDLTTQIPHKVEIALEKGAETPRIDFPPLSVHRFSKAAFESGVEEHNVDGVTIRVYCPEKTLADCFKFRNKLGMDVVLEALKLYKSRKKQFKVRDILLYARICRVEKIMKPYLEVVI